MSNSSKISVIMFCILFFINFEVSAQVYHDAEGDMRVQDALDNRNIRFLEILNDDHNSIYYYPETLQFPVSTPSDYEHKNWFFSDTFRYYGLDHDEALNLLLSEKDGDDYKSRDVYFSNDFEHRSNVSVSLSSSTSDEHFDVLRQHLAETSFEAVFSNILAGYSYKDSNVIGYFRIEDREKEWNYANCAIVNFIYSSLDRWGTGQLLVVYMQNEEDGVVGPIWLSSTGSPAAAKYEALVSFGLIR